MEIEDEEQDIVAHKQFLGSLEKAAPRELGSLSAVKFQICFI